MTRARLLALAALASGAAAAVALGWSPTGPPPPPERPAPPATSTTGTASPATPARARARRPTRRRHRSTRRARRDPLPSRRWLARARPQATAVATSFLAALFALEAGEPDAADTIAATATRRLAARLANASPRLPPTLGERPPRAVAYAIDIAFDLPAASALVRAEVARGSDLSGIGLALTRTGGRWLVSELVE